MRLYSILRESSEPQEQGKGLARQKRQLERFCATWPDGPHEISPLSATVIESASRGSRQEWQQALEAGIRYFHQGLIDGYLFPEVDRESRNPLLSIPILKKVLDADIPVYFAEQRLHLDPHDVGAITRYTEAVAKSCAYIESMTLKLSNGRYDRAAIDGKHPTNNRMFGFTLVDGRRAINEPEAAALREAARIVLREGRVSPAVSYLNENGFRTATGGLFSTATMTGILRNRALLGETLIRFKENAITLHHDAILEEAIFQQVNAALDRRRLRAPRGQRFYAVTGLVICGCGAKWEPAGHGRHLYYRCKARCGEKSWRADKLEWEVNEAFAIYLIDRCQRRDRLELARKSELELRQAMERVEKGLERNKNEWVKLLRKDLGGYPAEIIGAAKLGLEAEGTALAKEKERLAAALAALPRVDPEEVERELVALSEPFVRANFYTGGAIPFPPSWERKSVVEGTYRPDMPRVLSREQAQALREMLLKLNATLTIDRGIVRISGQLPLAVSAKKDAF